MKRMLALMCVPPAPPWVMAADGPTSRPATATAPASLAARYPGDIGIGRDPAVLLHEDFSAGAFDRKRWSDIANKAGALQLVRPAANRPGGGQALQITATLGANTGGAGLRPAGDRKFTVAVEPWGRWGRYPPPGGRHYYCYWWKMPRSGDDNDWGQDFAPKAYAVPERGRWTCVEFMAWCNTPGRADGETAFWVDGRPLAHHKDINWRSSGELKRNACWLMLYVTENSAKTNKVNTVWFDDVVVATEYIGPPVPAGAAKPKVKPARPSVRSYTTHGQ